MVKLSFHCIGMFSEDISVNMCVISELWGWLILHPSPLYYDTLYLLMLNLSYFKQRTTRGIHRKIAGVSAV